MTEVCKTIKERKGSGWTYTGGTNIRIRFDPDEKFEYLSFYCSQCNCFHNFYRVKQPNGLIQKTLVDEK